ncbi:MAG: FKBP-type peptidyl-prolyl cis-trans isomerase [Candidatus Paceibacterota bacterium]|jgi:peptidylprolyl isomerase
MKPTQTGIAVALALTVVVLFFILPGIWPWSSAAPAEQVPVEFTTNTQATSLTTMPTVTTPITQLMMNDEVVGTGAAAEAGDSVTVNYVGALTDGTVFDASENHSATGFTFTLGVGQVIKGWDQGILGMKEGGKRQLLIPAELAYGNQSPAPSIPANSALVFEVELLKVEKGTR